MNDGVYRDARRTAGLGSALSLLGGLVLSSSSSADRALGVAVLALGQFLVWRGLITWSVAQGTEPLLREAASLRAALLGSPLVQGPAPAGRPALGDDGARPGPPAAVPPPGKGTPTRPATTASQAVGWDDGADRRRCSTAGCSAQEIPTSAYCCPACGARTTAA